MCGTGRSHSGGTVTGVGVISNMPKAEAMLPEDEWDGKPDITSILKPMIMEHLAGTRDAYTANQIIEDMELFGNELFREVEAEDVLDAVNDTLRSLEEDGKVQSKRIQIGHREEWFYRPVL